MNPNIVLYHPLQQPSLIPTHKGASGMTPSLATLDDAPSLKQREWIQSKLGEDVPHQYTRYWWMFNTNKCLNVKI